MTIVQKRHARNTAIILGTALAGGLITAAGVGIAPTAMLESLVALLGLPAYVPEAAPPLGTTARLALMGGFFVAAALAVGVVMLLLVRLTRKKPRRAVSPSAGGEAEAPGETPMLRRVDTHPDAPARRPIFAGSDLGTPFDEVRAALPAEPATGEVLAPDAAAGDAPIPLVLDVSAEPAPEADPVPVQADPWSAEPALVLEPPSVGTDDTAELLELTVIDAGPLPEADPVPEGPAETEKPVEDGNAAGQEAALAAPDPVPGPALPEAPAPSVPASVHRPVSGRESVSELLARLEDGLQRRATVRRPAAVAVEPSAPEPVKEVGSAPVGEAPADADAALRDALGRLRQMAFRGR